MKLKILFYSAFFMPSALFTYNFDFQKYILPTLFCTCAAYRISTDFMEYKKCSLKTGETVLAEAQAFIAEIKNLDKKNFGYSFIYHRALSNTKKHIYLINQKISKKEIEITEAENCLAFLQALHAQLKKIKPIAVYSFKDNHLCPQ